MAISISTIQAFKKLSEDKDLLVLPVKEVRVTDADLNDLSDRVHRHRQAADNIYLQLRKLDRKLGLA